MVDETGRRLGSITIMSTRRPSSPPPPATVHLVTELQPVIEALEGVANQHTLSLRDTPIATESLLRLRHTFIDDDHPREAKDAFRQLRGFQIVLNLLRSLADLYNPTALQEGDRRSLLLLFR